MKGDHLVTTRHRHTLLTLAGALLATPLRSRLADLRRRQHDEGYTTETVIVTALLVAGAILIIGIIVAKVVAKANSLTL
jgi:hypothetical protein